MAKKDAGEVDFKAMYEAQQAQIAELMGTVRELASRVPASEPEPLRAGEHRAYPRTVFRPGGVAGQIDHPGFDARVVETEREFAQALEEGWSTEMVAPDAEK
jgi:hypothetical protein